MVPKFEDNFQKNPLIWENLPLMTSGDLNIDLCENFTEFFVVILEEISNAFFSFSLRQPGTEIEKGGGGRKPPHTHTHTPGGGKYRASPSGRGL